MFDDVLGAQRREQTVLVDVILGHGKMGLVARRTCYALFR